MDSQVWLSQRQAQLRDLGEKTALLEAEVRHKCVRLMPCCRVET
jgi:hypothetical protein